MDGKDVPEGRPDNAEMDKAVFGLRFQDSHGIGTVRLADPDDRGAGFETHGLPEGVSPDRLAADLFP
jgi:hypothetical protein